MTCDNCGGAVELKEQEGATERGYFKEEYKCVNCGAKGYIDGKAQDTPKTWNRWGGVFEE